MKSGFLALTILGVRPILGVWPILGGWPILGVRPILGGWPTIYETCGWARPLRWRTHHR